MSDSSPTRSRLFQLPAKPASPSQAGFEVSRLWWLWLPVVFFLLRYAVSIFTHRRKGLEAKFLGEHGVIENLTVLLLFVAMIGALYLLRRYAGKLHLAPKAFLVFYALGCLYFLGEEASWGQHWFGWETSEFFKQINDQQETNLHNTHELLDRVPKGIVSLAIFIGGIAVPLYMRRKSLVIDYQQAFWWLFPTWICLPTAIFATVATWPSKIEKATGWKFYFDSAQEMKELYIAFFFLLFIASLVVRMRRLEAEGKTFSPL